MIEFVYVAWGHRGEDFTLHYSEAGARGAVIEEAIQLGIVDSIAEFVEAESFADLDGFCVERYEIEP